MSATWLSRRPVLQREKALWDFANSCATQELDSPRAALPFAQASQYHGSPAKPLQVGLLTGLFRAQSPPAPPVGLFPLFPLLAAQSFYLFILILFILFSVLSSVLFDHSYYPVNSSSPSGSDCPLRSPTLLCWNRSAWLTLPTVMMIGRHAGWLMTESS